MNLRQRAPASSTRPNALPPMHRPFNIIPIHNLLADHPSLRFPELRAASASLRAVGDLRKPSFLPWLPHHDLLDWLGFSFGFQADNVRNSRDHLVLHLANSQMRLNPPPNLVDVLDAAVLRRFRLKLLQNYSSWCAFLGHRSNLLLSSSRRRAAADGLRRELLYVALYLLVWGEAGNLRFAPECVCYIYHHMAMELNMTLDGDIDPGRPFTPSICGENAFLKSVIMPIYSTIREEVESSRKGTRPHSAWRNYDDVNEYFWSRRCFKSLRWPINLGSNFFATVEKERRIGKTGFVEQRSFWNLFRSFDKLWVMLLLFLQAALIVAWEGEEYPWTALENTDVRVQLLTVFITWAGLRVLQAVLDAGTQYSLVTRETLLLGVRMVLKTGVAMAWTVIFAVFYIRIWAQKNSDQRWSDEANSRVDDYLWTVLVFVIPELLAIVLFIVPWVRNFIEELNWRAVYVFTWWFYTRIFVGRALREGLINNIKYTVFWIIVLASKFAFSYFLQIKPLVNTTKSLMKIKVHTYKMHVFFEGTNVIAVVLWVPVLLIYLMDLQIWYAIH